MSAKKPTTLTTAATPPAFRPPEFLDVASDVILDCVDLAVGFSVDRDGSGEAGRLPFVDALLEGSGGYRKGGEGTGGGGAVEGGGGLLVGGIGGELIGVGGNAGGG